MQPLEPFEVTQVAGGDAVPPNDNPPVIPRFYWED